MVPMVIIWHGLKVRDRFGILANKIFFLQKWLTATQEILLQILVKILNTQLKATWE